MRNLLFVAATLALSLGAFAQDKITLANGDVITGKVISMVDGKVTIKSPLLDDIVVPIGDVSDLVTKEPVTLKTKSGDLWERRIVGIDGGNLQLEGGGASSLAITNLGMINPPPKPAPTWTGSLKFTGINSTGNTERRAAGLSFAATRRSESDRFSADAAWDYAEDKPVGNSGYNLTQRRAGGGLKYDYYLSEKSYALVTSRVLRDTIAHLEMRFTGGAGLGYTLIDGDNSLLLLEMGLSYFNEDYIPEDEPSVNHLAVRAAYRFEYPISKTTKIVHRSEAFPSIEESDEFYCQVTTELATSLTTSMVASLTHVLDYDNTPAATKKRADNRVVLSVGWSF